MDEEIEIQRSEVALPQIIELVNDKLNEDLNFLHCFEALKSVYF